MKIGFLEDYRLGVVLGESIVDVSSAVAEIPRLGPHGHAGGNRTTPPNQSLLLCATALAPSIIGRHSAILNMS